MATHHSIASFISSIAPGRRVIGGSESPGRFLCLRRSLGESSCANGSWLLRRFLVASSDDRWHRTLGTTNSLIGVYESGFPTLLAMRRKATDSSVFYMAHHSGWTGSPSDAIHPSQSDISSVKRLIGRRFGDEELKVSPERSRIP